MTMLLIVVALALGLAAFDVLAQVSRSSASGPFDIGLLLTYGWVVAISMLGGIASFRAKVKAGQARWVNLGEFFGELTTSALAGLITYWLCRYAGLNEWLAAAFVAIAGHMGTRAIFMLERVLERWFGRFAETAPTEPKRDV